MKTEDQNFTTTLWVDQSPEEVFNAINNVRGWWSDEIDGSMHQLNDEFKYHFEDIHRCRMRLTEVAPNEKIVWLVLDNYFKPGIFEDGSRHGLNNTTANAGAEWVGTQICFEISKKGDKTQLVFTHIGLIPEYECFNTCSNGWTHYIQQSLLGLITTGKGEPNSTGKPMTTDEISYTSKA
jgi:hypothetical protein